MNRHVAKRTGICTAVVIFGTMFLLITSRTASALWPGRLLTEEAARRAILKVGRFRSAPIIFALPSRNAELPGHWYCDLKHKAFWIDVREAGGGSVYMGGKFEPVVGGTWKARLTFSKSLQPSLGPLGPNPPEPPSSDK
jgi:hypothetical protein